VYENCNNITRNYAKEIQYQILIILPEFQRLLLESTLKSQTIDSSILAFDQYSGI
jgi:hypothetical protein